MTEDNTVGALSKRERELTEWPAIAAST